MKAILLFIILLFASSCSATIGGQKDYRRPYKEPSRKIATHKESFRLTLIHLAAIAVGFHFFKAEKK